VLEEAFTRRPGTRVEVANVHSLPEISRLAGDDAYETAAVLSREAWPGGLGGGGPFDGLPMVVGNELTDDVVIGEDADAAPTVVSPPARSPTRRWSPGRWPPGSARPCC
jgi:hypothetical protein